jgi:predicted metal-binding protein
MDGKTIMELALNQGADKAAALLTQDVVFDTMFRDICKSNGCGNYGKCYMCPPDVGDIEDLIWKAQTFGNAVMYQAIYAIEDSFDFEGMQAAGKAFNLCARRIQEKAIEMFKEPWLHLAAGGCRVCETCAKRGNLPCRSPGEALASLESYGVDVYHTSSRAGLKYTNGENTVTYFGMLLF